MADLTCISDKFSFYENSSCADNFSGFNVLYNHNFMWIWLIFSKDLIKLVFKVILTVVTSLCQLLKQLQITILIIGFLKVSKMNNRVIFGRQKFLFLIQYITFCFRTSISSRGYLRRLPWFPNGAVIWKVGLYVLMVLVNFEHFIVGIKFFIFQNKKNYFLCKKYGNF